MFIEKRLTKDQRKTLTIALDKEVKAELTRLAKLKSTSVTKLIEALVRDYSNKLDNNEVRFKYED